VDIIGNTAYLNSASKGLEYSQIYTYGSDDVRILNNILVAPVADVAGGEKPEPVNRNSGKNSNVVFAHNLYWGGNIPPTLGDGDKIGDPQFVNAARDGKTADFRLKPGSPAARAGAARAVRPVREPGQQAARRQTEPWRVLTVRPGVLLPDSHLTLKGPQNDATDYLNSFAHRHPGGAGCANGLYRSRRRHAPARRQPGDLERGRPSCPPTGAGTCSADGKSRPRPGPSRRPTPGSSW
jgi:hypothetical protein